MKKRTARKPFTIGGVEWVPYQTGVNAYTTYSACERAAVWRPSHRRTHRASVDGKTVGERFRSEEAACAAAARTLLALSPEKELGVLRAGLSNLCRAIDFYDRAQADPKGAETGTVRDGLEWVLTAARALAGPKP